MAEPILIGARGWEHDDWRGGFYPEELPADWRFSYYSNLLRAVLVSGEAWETAAVEQVRPWAEDCDPDFRFVLELPAELSAPQTSAAIRHLLVEFFKTMEPIRLQTAGLLLRVAPAAPLDEAWLEHMLELLRESYAVCVDLPTAWRTPDTLISLARHRAGLCWHTADEPAPHPGGRLLVALSQEGAPKAQRRLLELLSQWREAATAVAGGPSAAIPAPPRAALFFDSPGRAAEQAKQARLLAEMMMV
jgi:uncharacterized protein YecE (DUF72 family)